MLKRFYGKVVGLGKDIENSFKSKGQRKVFCIGRNKTGTTSLKRAFEDLGYSVANQRKAEILAGKYYFEGNFSPSLTIAKLHRFSRMCHSATRKHINIWIKLILEASSS